MNFDRNKPPVSPEEASEIHFGLQDRLPIWTITERPADYPDGYVARLFISLPEPVATNITLRSTSLEDLRNQLPPGLVSIGRDPVDNPVILESWI